MYLLITILIFIVCILLILIVLVQNSKGGGLASNFQSSNQVMGVRKTTDFLEKATWSLAGLLLFLSVLGTAFISHDGDGLERSRVQEQIQNVPDPMQVPNFPTSAPDADDVATPPTDGNAE